MRLLAAFVLVMTLTDPVSAETDTANWAPCRLLQYQLNRLYFDVGEESRVFAGHKAVVIRKKDTVWSGVIDQSYEGISISRPTNFGLYLKSLSAFVQKAPYDSHAVLRIGTIVSPLSLSIPSGAMLSATTEIDGLKVHTYAVDALTKGTIDSIFVILYADRQAMQMDLEAGLIDGCLSYRSELYSGDETRMDTAMAPFIAAMIPSHASPRNRRGVLTSALHYLLDTAKVRVAFDGSGMQFLHSFIDDTIAPPPFGFDPERGRQLIRAAIGQSDTVKINSPDKEMRKVANYMADILARNQCRTDIVGNHSACDFIIALLPARWVSPFEALDAVGRMLRSDASLGVDAAATLEPVLRLLDSASIVSDTIQRLNGYMSAERQVIDDLGCFPLFRPKLFFVRHKSIVGEPFDSDGRLNPTKLAKLRWLGRAGPR